MADIRQFRRRPRNAGQFRGQAPRWTIRRRESRWGYVQAMLLTLGVSIGLLVGLVWIWKDDAPADPATFSCWFPKITDGDTLRCGSRRVRLYGIDAPEMPGHCRPGRECTPGDPYASTANLRSLTRWSSLQCQQIDIDGYGRTVARCTAGEKDLSCAQTDGGFAIARYGAIAC